MSSKTKQSLLFALAVAPLLAMGQQPPMPAFPATRPPARSAAPATPSAAAPAVAAPAAPTPAAPAAPAPAAPAAPAPAASAPGLPSTVTPALAAAVGAVPAEKEKEPAIYNYNLVGTPMEQILEDPTIGWAALVGRTLLRATATDSALKGTITLKTKNPLTRTEAIMALETVLGMNGVTIVPIGDKFAKVVLDAAAPQAGGAVSTNGVPEMGRFITQIVQWKYASPQDITEILKPFTKSANSVMVIPSTQTLVLRDYAENVRRMMEMIERIDIPSTFEMKPEIIPIKYALASDISQVLSSLGGSAGVSVGRSMGGGGLGQAPGGYRSSASGMNSGMVGGMAGQTSMGGTMGGGLGGTTGGGGARSQFQSNLANLVKKAAGAAGGGEFQILGQSKIIADERTNSLLVFANKDDMEMIKLIISKLDVVLAQVLIEAIIMEVTLNNGRDVGISYLQKPQNFGSQGYPVTTVGGLNNSKGADVRNALLGQGGTNSAFQSGFSYLAQLNGDLDIVATAIATDSRANVLSRPRIQTSHAVPASLFVGQTVPYVTGTYFNGGYAGGNSSQYTQKEVGISLEVLPLINPDGLVVMDIRQDIEDLGPDVVIDGNNVPTTTKRNADAKVAVRDRETIMLGGFISASKNKSHSGIPLLMDIPFLGALFRSSSDSNSKVELIVLIRPTVLPTPQTAAVFATEERNKMSGVKAAELEIREDERKSNELIEKQLKKEAERKAKKEKEAAKSGKNAPEVVPHFEEKQTVPTFQQPVPQPVPQSPTESGTHIEE